MFKTTGKCCVLPLLQPEKLLQHKKLPTPKLKPEERLCILHQQPAAGKETSISASINLGDATRLQGANKSMYEGNAPS